MADKKGIMRALSDIISRAQLAARAGLQHEGKRDLYRVFGYKTNITSLDILTKVERQDIVARLVDILPKATWSGHPVVTSDSPEFDAAWKKLVKRHKVWTILERADRMVAVGRYSGILIGVDDGQEPEQPVNRRSGLDVIYLQVIGDYNTQITEFETDDRNPRFGRPKHYNILFDDPATKHVVGADVRADQFRNRKFNWERIIHIVENPLQDDTFSIPRIAQIYNLLDDLLKVAGGTAETFWMTSNRGMQANIDKEMDLDEEDAKALEDELEEYQHELRRMVRTRGVDIKSLGSEPPDPSNVFDMIISLICAHHGIPRRIFIGSEQGSLASEQDRANMADRIAERRGSFAQPYVLEPFIDRLMDLGILPEAEYEIEWPDAFKMSPLERAQTMAQKGRSAANLSKQLELPVVSQDEARRILGLVGSFPETAPARDDGSEGEGESGNDNDGGRPSDGADVENVTGQ